MATKSRHRQEPWNKGRIVGEQMGCEASQESIMECIMGNNMEVN